MVPRYPTWEEEGVQTDEPVVQIQCSCGNWLDTETRNQRIRCACGKLFAVTVTEIPSKPSQVGD